MAPTFHYSNVTLRILLGTTLVLSFTRSVESFVGIPHLLSSSSSSFATRHATSIMHPPSSLVITSTTFLSMDHSHSTTSTTTTTTTTKSSMEAINNKPIEIQSYLDWMELMDSSDDKITLVWFQASFCKTCQAFSRKWKQIIVPWATAESSRLQLATVDFQVNRKLCQELHISHLPTIQFYYKEQLLTSYTITPKEFRRLEQSLEYYLNDSSLIELEYEATMEQKRLSFKDDLSTAMKLNHPPKAMA